MAIRKSCDVLERGGVSFTAKALGACCFAYDNAAQGCVQIMKFAGGSFPDKEYFTWRDAAIARIANGDKSFTCTCCPMLQEKDWPDRDKQIRYIVVTMSTVCQLDCGYCWSVVDGTKHTAKATYDVIEPIKDMVAKGLIDKRSRACIGGGEPTILPNFVELFSTLSDAVGVMELPTNSVMFSPIIAQKLRDGNHVEVITSFDCGTKDGFMRERGGKDHFASVVKNFGKYYATGGKLVTAKYIVTYTNSNDAEVDAFISLMDSKFPGVGIKLDTDFRVPLIDRQLYALSRLYFGLKNSHSVVVQAAATVRINGMPEVIRVLARGNFLVNLLKNQGVQIAFSDELVPGLAMDFDCGFYTKQKCELGWVVWSKKEGTIRVESLKEQTLHFCLRTGHFPLYAANDGKYTAKIHVDGNLLADLTFTLARTETDVIIPVKNGITEVKLWCHHVTNAHAVNAEWPDDRDLGLMLYDFYTA